MKYFCSTWNATAYSVKRTVAQWSLPIPEGHSSNPVRRSILHNNISLLVLSKRGVEILQWNGTTPKKPSFLIWKLSRTPRLKIEEARAHSVHYFLGWTNKYTWKHLIEIILAHRVWGKSAVNGWPLLASVKMLVQKLVACLDNLFFCE